MGFACIFGKEHRQKGASFCTGFAAKRAGVQIVMGDSVSRLLLPIVNTTRSAIAGDAP
jgi:hypothetical protein